MSTPTFTMFHANCVGNAVNCLYSHKVEIADADTFRQAVRFDHVYAAYRDNYRSVGNFISANALPVDCDNDHSDEPADWITPEDVAAAFPNVAFVVHYSRHHLLMKSFRSPRPRFHVIFAIEPMTDAKAYADAKTQVQQYFPYFDTNALDAARFFFGTTEPIVEFHEGSITLTQFLADYAAEQRFAAADAESDTIPEGSRNSTMSHTAGCLLKRYGNTEEAYTRYLEQARKCNPPLEDSELDTIWRSALNFFNKVQSQPGYVPPEQYGAKAAALKPDDYSDVGQASVLAREYSKELRYSPSTDYIRYNGICWQESKSRAQAAAQELTDRQLAEARKLKKSTWAAMEANGAAGILAAMGAKKAADCLTDEQAAAYQAYQDACDYFRFVVNRRLSKNIASTLKEARPMLEIDRSKLDADGFLLNTPDCTYDLRKGLNGKQEHRASDYITKVTTVSPSDKGMEEWLSALDTIFCGDTELTEYVQRVVGLAAIGKVYVEALIIAHGEGRNGKSTFWNVIARVLGSYSGNISADALTVGCRRNVKPELAEAHGKRLLIAAELEEGTRLNTSIIKQLCSTDEIEAEKKYKDPFHFIPSHTLVLYTNHLPKVGANDPGTWRRLLVIPFNALIQGKGDIKNYADWLYENCGEAILAWVIHGAQKIIAEDFHPVEPDCVTQAIAKYREDNDWLGHFIAERCDVGDEYRERSGDLYAAYRGYCSNTGAFTRSTADFYSALEFAGFRKHKERTGSYVDGLKLKDEDSLSVSMDFLGISA